jgi:hypothetical protein
LRKGALGGDRTREGVGGTLADRERTPNALLHLERTPNALLHLERTPNALLHLERTVNKRPSALGGDRVVIELPHVTIRRARVVRTHVRELSGELGQTRLPRHPGAFDHRPEVTDSSATRPRSKRLEIIVYFDNEDAS